jgi:2-haloacid dehalogenase
MGIVTALEETIGNNAFRLAALWRQKQLEYTFRKAAMGRYEDFVVCTRQALHFAAATLGETLAPGDEEHFMAKYRELPAYPEVRDVLNSLRDAGHALFAFSNGHPDDLAALLAHAGIDALLDGVVSVHDVQSFKPDPAVYEYFLGRSGASADNCWLVSGNAFDIIGADACGWRTAWVKRDPGVQFDPWQVEPTVVVKNLSELGSACGSV